MDGYILQSWTTIRGTGTTPVVQTSMSWLDLQQYADVTFFLEVKAVTNPGSGSVQIAYETSPTVDDTAFQAMATLVAAPSATPTVTKVLLSQCKRPVIPTLATAA